ncbi:DNA repair protein [Pseudomonas chlororaphis]|uniref:DNA repair protein n=1 Tax=Pseudomonas chlororaphis TaxID=587753 RepID=A0AB34C8R1_9PSED|nr:DNA repair protein [Pseudomonas chlororaphis]KAA5842097.1 DNA repair protein [Pseudomonas chlororaphis]
MRGSMWTKWDLHLHSPLTNLNNQFKTSIEDYAKKLVEHDIALAGITNYFFFQQDELEKIRGALSQLNSDTTILGNLEFRLAQPNKDGEWINAHLVFSERLTTRQINSVLEKFKVMNTNDQGMTIWCSEESFKEHSVTASDVVVDLKSLLDHLQGTMQLGSDFLVAICPCGYGGFQPNATEGRSVAVAKEIDKHGQLVFGRERDRAFFLDSTRYEGAIAKPVYLCSDAHCVDLVGSKYTWVKASPNFQGLRQTIFEPSDRVQQSDSFTEKNFIKPYFSEISISGRIFKDSELSFKQQEIPLNPNLVAIIGGRGTGKSIFLDSMLSRLNKQSPSQRAGEVSVEKITITLNQGGDSGRRLTFDELTSDAYSYLHVSQGDIHNFSKNPSSLSAEIKRMLSIRDEEFDPVTTQEISENLSAYRGFIEFWQTQDSAGELVNTPQYQEGVIEKNLRLIITLTSDQNKGLIEKYQENSSALNAYAKTVASSNELKALIERTLKSLNERITEYNNQNNSAKSVESINAERSLLALAENIESAHQESLKISNANDIIKAEFTKQGINQDISSLLNKVKEYQSAIDHANQKLVEIKERTDRYHNLVVRRGELATSYNVFVEKNRLSVDVAFGALQQINHEWNDEQNKIVQDILKNISITGMATFDTDKFYSGIENCLNRGKFRSSGEKNTRQKLEETFNVTDSASFLKLISGQKIVFIGQKIVSIEQFFWESEYFNQGGRYELMNYLFNPRSIQSYYYVNAQFTYKGKPVSKLSVGQRGTFYVCLKLATDPFGSPFVFDQPEDDLDNEFIVSDLVPLFKSIKKYRQVIIVTHNANLVVNADAEQVIVASNDGDIISYTGGALEDGNVRDEQGIKAMVCRILEGGHTAFENRERKYGIA